MKDRRFGRGPSFLFFMMDAIEKHNTSLYPRRVVGTANRGTLTVKDVTQVNHDGSKSLPPLCLTISSQVMPTSVDMKTIFNNLDEPQLFKRKWTRFFQIYVMKKWGATLGGIKDFS